MRKKHIIWIICDGKRGHENQSMGLVQALQSHLPGTVDSCLLDLSSYRASWWAALNRRFEGKQNLPNPDLIVSAGSRTQSSLFAAGRATGAPTVLIMAPPRGLLSLFDLCIIPAHDQRTGDNVVETLGAMNRIDPRQHKDCPNGLFLIGGPSQHFGWDAAKLIGQIESILAATPDIKWTLANSRRTPELTTTALQQAFRDAVKIIPVESTTPEWLPTQLAQSRFAWVTEDSVSMVYEALSSGAEVGLLNVPRISPNARVTRGLDTLRSMGYLQPREPREAGLRHAQNLPPLNEAERVARIVAERFFADSRPHP